MTEQKYEEAVVHAANSPKASLFISMPVHCCFLVKILANVKGVLRTSETLSQFKAAIPKEDKVY
jgi:hypothetical protein